MGTYLAEIDELDFPTRVKINAIEVLNSLDVGIVKGKKRKALLLMCIYLGYQKIDQTITVEEIAHVFGIEKKKAQSEIKKAVNKFLIYFKSNYVNYVPPIKYVKKYCKVLFENEDQIVDDIISFSENILNTDPILCEIFPQIIAAALIYFFISNYLPENKFKLAQIPSICEKPIEQIKDKVKMVKKIVKENVDETPTETTKDNINDKGNIKIIVKDKIENICEITTKTTMKNICEITTKDKVEIIKKITTENICKTLTIE